MYPNVLSAMLTVDYVLLAEMVFICQRILMVIRVESVKGAMNSLSFAVSASKEGAGNVWKM